MLLTWIFSHLGSCMLFLHKTVLFAENDIKTKLIHKLILNALTFTNYLHIWAFLINFVSMSLFHIFFFNFHGCACAKWIPKSSKICDHQEIWASWVKGVGGRGHDCPLHILNNAGDFLKAGYTISKLMSPSRFWTLLVPMIYLLVCNIP